MTASFCRGRVFHTRQSPLEHAFDYPVFFWTIDLDDLAGLNALWPLAGYDQAAVFSVRNRDLLGESAGSVRDKFLHHFAGRAVASQVVRLELLTTPRIFGHGYNPVNFYFGYDAAEVMICAVAEINNTYGETHLYVLDEPLPSEPGTVMFRTRKDFFVSPFFDLRGEYCFEFRRTVEEVEACVTLWREGEPALSARLWGRAGPLTQKCLLATLIREPLTAALAMPRIAWEARKLKRKGLPALLKPESNDPMTIRRVPRRATARRT